MLPDDIFLAAIYLQPEHTLSIPEELAGIFDPRDWQLFRWYDVNEHAYKFRLTPVKKTSPEPLTPDNDV